MALEQQVRVEIVRKIRCYVPVTRNPEAGAAQCKSADGITYWAHLDPSLPPEGFRHFPVIIDPDGVPWESANRYLLSRLRSIKPGSHRTFESIARDLTEYRKWLLEEDIDFLSVPAKPRARPTYRYAAFLQDLVRQETIKPSTAKRRMTSAINFYRWLIQDGAQFQYPLWEETSKKILFNDSRGFRQEKDVVSTNLARLFNQTRQTTEYSEYIDDGGKLRPLRKEEQLALFQSLKRIGNTEMTLAFLLAITTGARLQTVFTLREEQVVAANQPGRNSGGKRVPVGANTKVDTKNGKKLILVIPNWLYEKLEIYVGSERRSIRVAKSEHVYPSPTEQYLFLTRTGRPYYMSAKDPFADLYRSPPRGNAVTQFIRQQLVPDMKEHGNDLSFRFHDLRATFGMNLVESVIQVHGEGVLENDQRPEFLRALMYVRERMGHSNLQTTEKYLRYRENVKVATYLQGEFERFLEGLWADG